MKVSKKTILSARDYLCEGGAKPTDKKTLAYIATIEKRIASLLTEITVFMPENQKLLRGRDGKYNCCPRNHLKTEGEMMFSLFHRSGSRRIRNWIPANEPALKVYRQYVAEFICVMDKSEWEDKISDSREIELDLTLKMPSNAKKPKRGQAK